jgi:hypothetical protein
MRNEGNMYFLIIGSQGCEYEDDSVQVYGVVPSSSGQILRQSTSSRLHGVVYQTFVTYEINNNNIIIYIIYKINKNK